MNKTLLLPGALLCLCLPGVRAQSDTVNLPTVEVKTSSNLPSSRLNPEGLPSGTTADALNALPGLQLRRTGANGSEPVIRGLGWERVQTRFNGLPLHGACPSRMDPPVNLFALDSLDAVRVEVGPASVIEGPAGTAGALNLSTTLQPSETPETSVILGAGAESQGKVRRGQARVEGASATQAWRIDSSMEKRGDYTAGDGTRVPAGANHQEATVNLLQHLGNGHSLSVSGHWKHETDTEYVALPMDSRYAKTLLGTAEWIWQTDADVLRSLELRGGLTRTDHRMDNRDKPNRRMMQASTPSESDGSAVRFLSRWTLGTGEFRAGADASRLERDATRTRSMSLTGMTFRDPIWPGGEQDQTGLFAEWEGGLAPDWQLRAGLRTDWIESDATRSGERIVPGAGVGRTTVADAYRDVGGSDGSIEQDDHLWSGTMRLSRVLPSEWMLHLSLGRTESAPNLTQRYQAFGPMPGGFGVGNPSLDPEIKQEIELRTEGGFGSHRLGLAAHAARIDDFLLPTTLALLDVNGDGRIDRVRGYRNQDVERWGLEAEADLSLCDTVRMPLRAEWVRARTTDGTDVPETPPLELSGALQWTPGTACNPHLELGIRYAHRQDRIDPGFGEDETPSFATVHLRLRVEPVEGWTVEAGIENLFDRTYHEHLTREAVLPVGDLAAGDEVPGPGRSFTLSIRTQW